LDVLLKNLVLLTYKLVKIVYIFTVTWKQCCRAGVEEGEAVIKLPSGAGAVTTNYGLGSLLFYQNMKRFIERVMVASIPVRK
jgi:hypothetical protein